MKCSIVSQTVVATFLILASASVKAKCPHKPLERVQECTANVLPDLQSRGPDEPEDYTSSVQVTRDGCRNSLFRSVADCIQDILDRCRGTTEEEQVLQRLIDKQKTMDTVDYFCRHIKVYENNAKCIARHHEEVSICSQDAQKSFKTKMNAGASMDVLITGSCRFHNVARECLTDTTKRRCGREAADFVFTLLTGLAPPYCDSTNPEYKPVGTDDTTRRWTRRWDTDRNDDRNGCSRHQQSLALALVVVAILQCILPRG